MGIQGESARIWIDCVTIVNSTSPVGAAGAACCTAWILGLQGQRSVQLRRVCSRAGSRGRINCCREREPALDTHWECAQARLWNVYPYPLVVEQKLHTAKGGRFRPVNISRKKQKAVMTTKSRVRMAGDSLCPEAQRLLEMCQRVPGRWNITEGCWGTSRLLAKAWFC